MKAYLIVLAMAAIAGLSGLSWVSGRSGLSWVSGRSGLSGLSGRSAEGISAEGFSAEGISGLSGLSGRSGRSAEGISGRSGLSGPSAEGISGFSAEGISGEGPLRPQAQVMKYVGSGLEAFAAGADSLDAAIRRLDPRDSGTILAARQALIRCRIRYKGIRFFLEYFFRSSALIYDQPAKYEAEEPYIEWEAPRGMQYIESLLFGGLTDSTLRLLREESQALAESAADLGSLLYDFHLADGPLMESLRLELIRVMTLEITGYDAPLLKSGIQEAAAAMAAFASCVEPYLGVGRAADSVRRYLGRSLALLAASPGLEGFEGSGGFEGFDGFDRMAFLRDGALPLQRYFGDWIESRGLGYQSVAALNYRAADLFSRDAINIGAFPGAAAGFQDSTGSDGRRSFAAGKRLFAAAGKRLFFDKRLSADGSRSCATCHRPDRLFSDGRVVSPAMVGHRPLVRNTPSLLYAGYQYNQFWDGRARSLEEQVAAVLRNPAEMGADPTRVDIKNCAAALAAYVRTLAPFRSALDRYFSGDRRALQPAQVRGFNLFMGKAGCGTCHFAPLFNGLRPPLYDVTEFEVLGVPAMDSGGHTAIDSDNGRYAVYRAPFYRRAFKTPTVRDAARTAPYMHNGQMKDMRAVIDFYNKGGGTGMGLTVADQTLDSRPLGLSPKEVGDLIAFVEALTDR